MENNEPPLNGADISNAQANSNKVFFPNKNVNDGWNVVDAPNVQYYHHLNTFINTLDKPFQHTNKTTTSIQTPAVATTTSKQARTTTATEAETTTNSNNDMSLHSYKQTSPRNNCNSNMKATLLNIKPTKSHNSNNNYFRQPKLNTNKSKYYNQYNKNNLTFNKKMLRNN
ncbi:hypothetical protein HELRODRAFT_174142 [Helobdella robusta]|uniref:Uncharacterized protein n=1 Tax=Helobdella robusta TaxID=6412 RepID=T1F7P2_HELRO|nr:hypothetical protein HELRODRAFT_174142 [Helobdella robusta]ESO02738.1 hypothetical protein HELRODRAFT_174142 [Helobdella robusta]